MKRIGIISAMDLELKPLLKLYPQAKKLINDIWTQEEKGKEIFFAISGIGKTNMASQVTYLIVRYNIDYVINIGVGGSLNSKIKPLDIVSATEVAYHDFDLTEFNHKYGQIPGCPLFFKSNNVLGVGTKLGLIVSGDYFAQEKDLKNIIKHFPNALAVDMESAACGQIATRFNIKWSVIRIISDDGSVVEYDKLKNEAANKLALEISRIINKI